MMELANIFATLQEGVQAAQATEAAGEALSANAGLVQQYITPVWDYLKSMGLGPVELSAITAAVVLALVWIFARVVRMVAGILFIICIVLLVLQLTGYMDTSGVWETVQGWFGGATPADAPVQG